MSTTQANAAVIILNQWDHDEINSGEHQDNMTAYELLVEAELYHVRDLANMRHGLPQYKAHQIECLTFEDNSRAVRFLDDSANYDTGWTKWSAV